jgi:hypothetical protein
MTATRRVDWFDAMTVDLPEATHGDVAVRRYTVSNEHSEWDRLRGLINGHHRYVPAGTYTGLFRHGHLWMSDTPDERRDHLPVMWAAELGRARRVLINGLGLGMVVRALLLADGTVEHIDVVEHDPAVIALVEPTYQDLAAEHGRTLTVHHDDAYTITWPAGTHWDVVWSDIWVDLNTDNLDGMAQLRRKYGRRSDWHECWGREELLRIRRRDRARGW